MPTPIDLIIMQVPLTAKSEPGRMMIYLDVRRRSAVDVAKLSMTDRALWSVREKLRYDISPDRKVVLENLQEQVSNFLTRETLPVDYRMRVWIRRENAVQAAEALCQPDRSPETVLRQHIGDFLAEKLEQQSRRSREAMATHFIANVRAWEAELVASLMREFGVSAEVLMDSVAEIEQAMRVSFGPLDVRPQDAPRQTGLSIIGDLVLVPDVGATEVPPLTEQGWVEMIRRCVERAYADRIKMREHLYDANQVRRELLVEINRRVQRAGRQVKPDSLFIRTRSSEAPPPNEIRVTAGYDWTSKRWGRKVMFQAEARMTLVAPADWPAGSERDPVAWFRATIGPAIESAMHGRDFDSLELEEDVAFRGDVAAIIVPRALAVGYKLELLIFVSQNEPREALKTFSVLIPPRLEDSWAGYETKRPRVRAKFQIEVRMRLTTLKGHAARFRGNRGLAALRDDVLEVAGDAARRHMLNVEANDYVNKWDAWLKTGKDETTIKGQLYRDLHRQIADDLQGQFAPAEFQIALYRDLSPLENFKAKALQIVLDPVSARPAVWDTENDSQEAVYALRYSIADVDPAYIVEVIATGRDQLSKQVLEQELARTSVEALRMLNSAELAALNYEDVTRPAGSPNAQRILAQVQRTMTEKYAIVLRLDGISRDRTFEERTDRGVNGIATNLRAARLATINRVIADMEAEHIETSRAASKEIRALEDALLKAQTADNLNMNEIAERRQLLQQAKDARIEGDHNRRSTIESLRADVRLVSVSTSLSTGYDGPGAATHRPRHEPDDL